VNGKTEIAHYYEVAPEIVERIDSTENAFNIYERIYADYIAPCVSHIKNGQNESAYKLYKAMIARLSTAFLYPS